MANNYKNAKVDSKTTVTGPDNSKEAVRTRGKNQNASKATDTLRTCNRDTSN